MDDLLDYKIKKYKTKYKKLKKGYLNTNNLYGGSQQQEFGDVGEFNEFDDSMLEDDKEIPRVQGEEEPEQQEQEPAIDTTPMGDYKSALLDYKSTLSKPISSSYSEALDPMANVKSVSRSHLEQEESKSKDALTRTISHYEDYENHLKTCMDKCNMRLPVCIGNNVRNFSDSFHTLQKLYHTHLDLNGRVN